MVGFFYYLSPRFTTSKSALIILFFFGMAGAGTAFILNFGVLKFLPGFASSVGRKIIEGETFSHPLEIGIIFFFLFSWVAPVEEFLKYLGIYFVWKKHPKEINQIIDGLKFGISVGLGFAAVENALYLFYPPFI